MIVETHSITDTFIAGHGKNMNLYKKQNPSQPKVKSRLHHKVPSLSFTVKA